MGGGTLPQKNRYEVLAEVEQLESERAGLLVELEAQRANLEDLNQNLQHSRQDLETSGDSEGLGVLRGRAEFMINSDNATINTVNGKINKLLQREAEIMSQLDSNNKFLEQR